MGKKKNSKVTTIKEQSFKYDYNKIINDLENQISIGCYTEWKTAIEVRIGKVTFNTEEIEHWELKKEIRKELIKQKLYISGIRQEGQTIIIETTDDLFSLLYAREYDEYEAERLEEIKQELKEEAEQEPKEEQQQINDTPCENSIKERTNKIVLTEELALNCGYKNLRGLKLSISRKLGKCAYDKETLEIDVIKLITVISKRADAKVIEELLSSHTQKETLDVKSSKEITTDTEKVINKVDSLIEEIKIRTGDFYSSCDWQDDVNCGERGGILAQLFAQGEITETELLETAKVYNLDLEINFKKISDGTAKDKYYKNISNSYSQYGDDGVYLDVVESKELNWDNIIECKFEEDKKLRKQYKNEVIKFGKDNITVARGYDSDYAYICIYNNKKLIGHYNLEHDEDYIELTRKLFEYDNINLKYIELAEQFKQALEKERLEEKQEEFESSCKTAKFKYTYKDYTFLVIPKYYSNKEDGIKIFKDIDIIGVCYLDSEIGGDNFDVEIDHNKDLKKLKKEIDNKIWRKFTKEVFEENRKLYKERKHRENYDADGSYDPFKNYKSNYDYSNYDWSNLLGNTTTVKEEDKPFYKKFYRTLAINFHPDKVGESGNKAMQIINELKQNWGI